MSAFEKVPSQFTPAVSAAPSGQSGGRSNAPPLLPGPHNAMKSSVVTPGGSSDGMPSGASGISSMGPGVLGGAPSPGTLGGVPPLGLLRGGPSPGGLGGVPSAGVLGGGPSPGGPGGILSAGVLGGAPPQGGPGGVPSAGVLGGGPSPGGPPGALGAGVLGGAPSQSGTGGLEGSPSNRTSSGGMFQPSGGPVLFFPPPNVQGLHNFPGMPDGSQPGSGHPPNSGPFNMGQGGNMGMNQGSNIGPPDPKPPNLSIPPNRTLYVNNLNDKIKIDELKRHLRSIFKQFGDIRDIIAMKSFWRRGQAWIVFRHFESAEKAFNGLQGFPFYDKPMRISYAITQSDVHSKEEGTLQTRPSGPKKPRAIREREEKQKALFQQMQQQFLQHMQQQLALQQQSLRNQASSVAQGTPGAAGVSQSIDTAAGSSLQAGQSGGAQMSQPSKLIGSGIMDKQSIIAAVQAKAAEAVREATKRRAIDASLPPAQVPRLNMFQDMPPSPNKLLFIENLPENVNEATVSSLFRNYAGFVEARVIGIRRIAFVDFENESQATTAMQGVQGLDVQGCRLKVSYAKK